MNKTIHLVCNAHLDPVWLWEWEEGAAEAISTFRTAADFCEQFDGFVFNHNESVLYEWIEEYEPELFKRIQRLVAQNKWHIMGGWRVQPDCNMPSGESFVRQALLGKTYFRQKFNVDVTTAINFDPFGHTRGLVQILKKCGYDSYLFCRPGQNECPLPADQFVWVGYDGSEVMATRASMGYASGRGGAVGKVKGWMEANPETPCGVVLWGVGNHGGGASREDLESLSEFIAASQDRNVMHSTAAGYFKDLARQRKSLPRHEKDINPWAVGCYTSLVRIKQRHRLLENEIYAAEKMASTAWAQGLIDYPQASLNDALEDLTLCEFHDILPGSCIQPAEEAALRLLDHGLETVSRVKARAFFALCGGQRKAKEGEIPVLVYNPHPYKVVQTVECEFQMADQNWEDSFTLATVHQGKKRIPSQTEKELSNLNLDWRKRVVFHAELKPSCVNRFDCSLERLQERPKPTVKHKGKSIQLHTDRLDVAINTETGLLDRYRVDGIDYLKKKAFQPLVIQDDEDPWGMRVRCFREVVGAFEPMDPRDSARFSGVKQQRLPAVRIIEDGDVRIVVEAVFAYRDSYLCQHYKLPKNGTELQVDTRVYWNEKDRLLKLSVPVKASSSRYLGQVAYGVAELPSNGDEAVAQKWVAAVSDDDDKCVTCINDGVYGSDFANGELRMTLLRSSAYSGHPIRDRDIVPQDRFTARIEQGERRFRFWINAGPCTKRLAAVDREALAHNEKPFALSFFPSGAGKHLLAYGSATVSGACSKTTSDSSSASLGEERVVQPGITLSDRTVQIAAVKKAEANNALIVRLFEPTGKPRKTTVTLAFANIKRQVSLGGFEIKTLEIDLESQKVREVNLLESLRLR